MHFKKNITKKVYALYLNGVALEIIGMHLSLSMIEVEEIIDYMNEIYN